MKLSIRLLSLVLFVFLLEPGDALAQTKNDLIGNWNAEAPTAPGGFQTSIIQITKDSVFTTFTGESYKYPSTFRNFKNDTLTFDISGIDVTCTLTFESKTKLKGNAVWSSGESILSLTKIDNPKSKN